MMWGRFGVAPAMLRPIFLPAISFLAAENRWRASMVACFKGHGAIHRASLNLGTLCLGISRITTSSSSLFRSNVEQS